MNIAMIKKRLSVILAVALCLSGIQLSPVGAAGVGKASATVDKRAKTTAQLKMNKVKGATGYQIFLATKKKGKYRQIGSTRNTSFIIRKSKKNKIYYVKVRAYQTKGYRIMTGKYSGVLKIGKYVEMTTADKYAVQVLSLVNEERAKEKLPALKGSAALNAAANIRAQELETSDSPTRPDGRNGCSVLTDKGIVYEAAGENIASGVRTPKEVVEKWMQDAGHRAQILSPDYTHMGLGYYVSSKGDKYYWSQIFMK